MELEKNSGSDLRNWQIAFFNLGLAVSIGTVLMAFEWNAEEAKPLLNVSGKDSDWNTDIIPITIQTLPPLPPAHVAPPEITIVDNQTKITDAFTLDINLPGDELIPEVILDGPPTVESVDEIVDFTEVQAQFIGGMDSWYRYLRKNLSYPKQAQRIGVGGTVLVRFVINTDGSVQDVEVVRSVDPSLDKAAVDVILDSPIWKPGLHHGKAVRSRMTIPIKFKLN